MKINPESSRILVNIITEDTILIYKLKLYEKRTPALNFIFSKLPLPVTVVDVYVIPAEKMNFFFSENNKRLNPLPVLVYGDQTFLSAAFSAGCSDFLKNPWDPVELYSRVINCAKKDYIIFPWGKISLAGTQVYSPFGTVSLSVQEQKILKILFKQKGEIVLKETLYYVLWGHITKKSRVVDMHISSIRKKISLLIPEGISTDIIKTAYGLGYFIP